MLRTQISLSDEERALLDAESARTGLSMSELIRRAVREALAGADIEADRAAIERAAGAWADRDESGAEFVERLRSGRRLAGAAE